MAICNHMASSSSCNLGTWPPMAAQTFCALSWSKYLCCVNSKWDSFPTPFNAEIWHTLYEGTNSLHTISYFFVSSPASGNLSTALHHVKSWPPSFLHRRIGSVKEMNFCWQSLDLLWEHAFFTSFQTLNDVSYSVVHPKIQLNIDHPTEMRRQTL